MSKFFSLFLIMPLFFVIIVFFAGNAIMKADYNEFEEYRLQKTNNYATDAAVDEMLYSDNLDQDYSDMSKVTLDPMRARDTYLKVLALTYDIPSTKESLESLSAQCLDLMIVCAYDGYYVISNDATLNEDIDVNTYTALSTTKLPYSYYDPTADKYYSITLGSDKAYSLSTSGLSEVKTPLTKSQTLTVVNKLVNNEIASRLNAKVSGGLSKAVNIPVLSTANNNNIENVSVISFLNGVKFTTIKELSAFSVGGTKVEATRMVACYRRNGKKMYCYTDLIPRSVAKQENIRTWAEHVVTSIEEAAAFGYSCDYELMLGGNNS